MWGVPLLLIIPNVVLDFTEISYGTLARIINICLPLGAYLLLCSLWKNVGRTVLLLIPVMVLCAFQIVLLFLYGESIIAVDMFLNVVTTNPREAGELLANLGLAMAVVIALYLPPIILGIIACAEHSESSQGQRRPARIGSAVLLSAGLACLAGGMCIPEVYSPSRQLFPVNVICNMAEAAKRTAESKEYFASSAGFKFNSRSTHPTDEPEVYVMVIGETSRAGNWQLNGYGRPTNPRLSRRDGIVNFPKTLSESNTTHKSVPLMMSHLRSSEFADSIYRTKGIIDAFREAGFKTAWFSNQQRNGALIDFFGEQADSVDFLVDDCRQHHDLELCACLHDYLGKADSAKLFVVLHTYGSHFNYCERLPEDGHFFKPEATEASPENREGLINAYDNTIRYVDEVLDSVMSELESCGRPAAMLYLADHGEDIYDDSRKRFLHASPTPTYSQLHVPMLLWTSDSYRRAYPELVENAEANSRKEVSSSRSAFHTLLSLAGIEADCYDPQAALTDSAYQVAPHYFLNDYNEAVPLTKCGLRSQDFQALARHGF